MTRFLLPVLAFALFPSAVRAQDPPALETSQWKASFSPRGAVARLVHKPTGQTLVDSGEDAPAYEFTVLEGRESSVASSAEAGAVRVEQSKNEVRFVLEHKTRMVTLTYRVEGGRIACRCRIENNGEQGVIGMAFPLLRTPRALGGSEEDDVLLYPLFDGCVMENPAAVFRRVKEPVSRTYPGPLSCQVMAFLDPKAGLYVASHDPDGHGKRFTVRGGERMEMSIMHFSPYVPGSDFDISYPVVIGPFEGSPKTTWYDAADIYREWSDRQEWTKKKVRTRTDTPDWLRRGALVTLYNPRGITRDGEQGKLREFLKDYTDRFGIPLLPNNRGYERHGTWCGQEYRPVRPSEESFKASAKVARELGGRSMVMMSGYRWTIETTEPEGEVYDSREKFDREVAANVVHGPDEKPAVSTSSRPDDWHGRVYSQMCRATGYAKKTIVEHAKYFVECGYSVIHFDQEVGGAYDHAVCWSGKHGHPPGHGRWIHRELADLYRKLCDACAPLDPDFMLSMEEPNELYLPWLSLIQARPYGVTPEWPCVPPLTRSVPLFNYLYHEHVITWAAFYPWKSAGKPWYGLAKGFRTGLMPGLVPPSSLRIPNDKLRERYLGMVANCVRGYRTFAHDYLVCGRMLKPLDLDVPVRSLPWRQGKREITVSVPAVEHSVWRLDDGRVGVVFLNGETEAHEIEVDLSAFPGGPAVLEVSTQEGDRVHKSRKLTVRVPPSDILLLEVRPE